MRRSGIYCTSRGGRLICAAGEREECGFKEAAAVEMSARLAAVCDLILRVNLLVLVQRSLHLLEIHPVCVRK